MLQGKIFSVKDARKGGGEGGEDQRTGDDCLSRL